LVLTLGLIIYQQVVEIDLQCVYALQVKFIGHPVYPILQSFYVYKHKLIVEVYVGENCLRL